MALVVGTNSYVTIVEADAFLTDRVEATDWFLLSDTGSPGGASKSSYLISAYYWLLSSSTLDLPETSSDEVIKNAQIEAAFYLLNHYTALDARRAAQAQGLESFRLSKKTEKYISPSVSEIPDYITGSLSGYVMGNSFVQLQGQYDV